MFFSHLLCQTLPLSEAPRGLFPEIQTVCADVHLTHRVHDKPTSSQPFLFVICRSGQAALRRPGLYMSTNLSFWAIATTGLGYSNQYVFHFMQPAWAIATSKSFILCCRPGLYMSTNLSFYAAGLGYSNQHLLLVATLIAFKPSSVEALAVHYLVASHSCINRKTKKATLPPNNLQQWEKRLKLPCLHLMADHQSLSRWSD
ncbi:hypothetical protein RRG08_018372 [Elysia crispata]|uniref:Uncharacterized protein n=1 Tax=Elysia crispata TaxID=231223 RepID=A0AAE0YN24_9GAST|nr:hypothetical protein RRG08_018372 [Elysia crispata]